MSRRTDSRCSFLSRTDRGFGPDGRSGHVSITGPSSRTKAGHAAGAGIFAPGALTASLLLAALVVLAPGQARAQGACTSDGNTPPTYSCTGTPHASGIIYTNQSGGTINVSGAATTVSITSGTGNAGSGITLENAEAPAGNTDDRSIVVTVGGTGANNYVAIAQRGSTPNTGSNNNGIRVNQRGRGVSATTVTTHAGVTIGTETTRMNRSGIHADVWLGTGAATITNAATIYSTEVGIYLQRGGAADTREATTITNSGAITAANMGLNLRYFAGDGTNDGDAKIENTGAIVKDASGWHGAIQLEYQGTGDAEVDNKGTVTATHDSAATPVALTSGYGIRLWYRANTEQLGDGAVTIKNTHAVMSTHDVLRLENEGVGAATIENSGALTATGTTGTRKGIWLEDRGTTTAATTAVATVENSGAITANEGIHVWVHNKVTAMDNVGISITHSDGAIVTSAGSIKGTIGDSDDTATANTGNIDIAVTSGSVQSGGTILEAVHLQAGDIDIEVGDGVTLTSTGGHGIFADMREPNTMGSVTIDNAGAITTPSTGIYVRRQATTGASTISVTNSGDIKKSGGDVNWDGILIIESGVGDVTVTNSGDIGEATAMHERGIRVSHQGAGAGGITITNSGAVVAGEFGILATKAGTSGDISVTTTDGSVTAKRGIYVEDNAGHTGTVTVANAGDVTAELYGILVDRRGMGAVSVTNSGGTVMGETEPGIRAENVGGASDVTVTVSGGTVQSTGQSKPAIHARQRGTGDLTVSVSSGATLISKHNAGLFAPLGAGNQVSVTQGGTILGRKGVYVQVAASTTAETVTQREASAQPVIDVAWSGTFAAGTTAQTAPNDNDRFVAATAANVLTIAQEVVTEQTIRYGSPAGIEAQVMSWREVMREVAKGDDPNEVADNAAQMALLATSGAASRRADILTQFRAALGNGDIEVAPAVITAIGSTATTVADLTDTEIVTYLETDNDDTRTLLRNILAQSFTDEEKAVLRAVVAGDSADLTAALTAGGFTDDAADDTDYWSKVMALLDRYNVGNIDVDMTGGSIDSRGDGIRAYYATPHANNGAIRVTVAAGTTVTGAEAGIYVANAGPGLMLARKYTPDWQRGEDGEDLVEVMHGEGDDEVALRNQLVTVHGTVTGGEDAAVHLSGGGAVLVMKDAEVNAGSSGVAILVNDPGPALAYIDGTVKGDDGGNAAVHLTGGGSVVVGLNGRVQANGASHAIRGGADAASEVDVVLAIADLYRESVVAAFGRVDGATAGVASETVREYRDGVPSGYRAVMRNADGTRNFSGFTPRPVAPPPIVPPPDRMPPPPPVAPTFSCADAGDGAYGRCRSEPNDGNDISVAIARGERITGSITGVQADFGTSDADGGISVTVAKGASVTGGSRDGIYVANAGEGLRIPKKYAPRAIQELAGNRGLGEDALVAMGTLNEAGDAIAQPWLNQLVTVEGTVTGGGGAAVHLSGGGAVLVMKDAEVNAGSSGVAILVNDPGPALAYIDGTVKGAAGGAAAVHLTGGGSAIVGLNGKVEANGATEAISGGEDAASEVDLVYAVASQAREDVQAAHDRVVGGTAGVRESYQEYRDGVPMGYTDDVTRKSDGTPDLSRFKPRDPGEGPAAPTFTFDCAGTTDGRCRLYEALPSMLLAMNGLPSYAERMSAARDGNGAWARVETARGEWQAKKATMDGAGELAYDHRRSAGHAGLEFLAGENARAGVSVHALRGKSEMTGVGEVKLDGMGVGASVTWLSGELYVDAQAAMTWYDADIESNIHRKLLKKGVSGAGYALGVDVGRRMPLGELFVTPRAGFTWSQVDLDDFMDMEIAGGPRARVSVEDAGSMKGRLGVLLEKNVGMGERSGHLFGSLDVEQELSDETEVKVGEELLKTEVRPTALRVGLGGVFDVDENVMVRATAGYSASGSGTSGYGGGLELRVQF